MNRFLKTYWPFAVLFGIVCVFFYKTIFFGLAPFPGDLLLSEYAPWRHFSYAGYAPGAVPTKLQYFDVIRELYPWKHLVMSELIAGRLPLWNPHNFSGSPLLANHQSSVFYPLNVLYFILPFSTAWSTLVTFQPLLGNVFTYLFATAIGLSPWPAITASVLFNFSYFSIVWAEFNTVWHTILWLPLILWCIEQIVQKQNRRSWVTIVLALAIYSSATAGHPQDFLYVLGFSGVYAMGRTFIRPSLARQGVASSKPALISLVFGFLGGLGLAAVQILPTIELFYASARAPHDYQFVITNMLIPPWQTIKVMVADFFGNPATGSYFLKDTYVDKAPSVGVVGFIFVILFLLLKKHTWHTRFFTLAAGATILLTVNNPLSRLLYRYPIPVLSTGTPTRILFIFAFSSAMLAGFGIELYTYRKKLFMKILSFLSVILIVLWAFALFGKSLPDGTLSTQNTITMQRAMLVATAVSSLVLLILSQPKLYKYRWLVTIIAAAELLYAFVKFNPFVPYEFMFPANPVLSYLSREAGINRFWGYGTASIPANIATLYRLYSPDGIDPLNLALYNRFIQSTSNGKIAQSFLRSTRSDASIAPGYGETDLPNNHYRLRVLDALGVKYILDRTENPKDDHTFSGDRFMKLWENNGWTVFQNTQAASRFFLTGNVLRYSTTENFERLFFDPSFDPKTMVLVETNASLPNFEPDADASVRLDSYTPATVTFSTHSNKQQLLFLSDAYDPGWIALVDGVQTNIIRANFAFRSVVVPHGDHTVVFSFRPKSLEAGGIVSAGVLLIGLTHGLLTRPKRRQ